MEWIVSAIFPEPGHLSMLPIVFNATFIMSAIQNGNFFLPFVEEENLFFDSPMFSGWGLLS